jgi:molybdate/tungstate transport system substrate-binding protein
MKRHCHIVFLLLAVAAILTACTATNPSPVTSLVNSSPKAKSRLIIFEADSLMVPFAQAQKQFTLANPGIDIQIQAHGSIQVVRQVTELEQDVDLVAVADYSLIPMLMYQTRMANGQAYANWYIEPATNQLGIAYTSNSKYASQINAGNWFEILSRPDVKIGLADPRMDAVGYRTIMLAKLAETYYLKEGLFQNMIGGCFSLPLPEAVSDRIASVTIPEILEPAKSRMVLRGANMQLISLLESNDVDYTFEYKSVVEQHQLNYLELPAEINLGSMDLADKYRKVIVKSDFNRFKTVVPVFEGAPIIYGLTIPTNAKHRDEAVTFLSFVLGSEGQNIFNSAHHPMLLPPRVNNPAALPAGLQSFFK